MRVQALMRPPAAPVVPELVEPWPDNDPEPAPPAVETEPPAPSHPAGTAALPEARSSANVRIQVCGHDVQITLRDHDESTLLARLTTLLAQYPAAAKLQPRARPTPRRSARHTACCARASAAGLPAPAGRWHLVQKQGDVGVPQGVIDEASGIGASFHVSIAVFHKV